MLIGMVAVVTPSCSGQKKSASMKKIERESRKDYRGKEEKKADAVREKQEKARKKEEEKAYKDGITRHRSFQTEETLQLMDTHLEEANDRYKKKEFFLVRWFKPKDDIEKIEKKRAKEVEKRMAATRKKADKNNDDRGATYFTGEERKVAKPNPSDMQHGGGGTYGEGNPTGRVNPADYQQGGGGSYQEGKSSSKAKTSDFQHGGGGSYQEGKSNSKAKSSDAQHGGGGDMSGGNSKKVKPSSKSENTKGTSPGKNPFSKKSKPKPGD